MRDPRINRIMGSNSGLFGTRQFFCDFDSSQVRDSCAVLPKSGDLQTAMKHVNLHVTDFFVILSVRPRAAYGIHVVHDYEYKNGQYVIASSA